MQGCGKGTTTMLLAMKLQYLYPPGNAIEIQLLQPDHRVGGADTAVRRHSLNDEGRLLLPFLLLLIAVFLGLFSFTFLLYPGFLTGQSAPLMVEHQADYPVISGHVTGYADRSGNLGPVSVTNSAPDPGKLGAVTLKIRLNSLRFIIDKTSGLDLTQAKVTFDSGSGTEILKKTDNRPMKKPGWTITEKTGTLPYGSADSDDILEQNEEFELFIYPERPLFPSSQFTAVVQLPYVNPLVVNRTVPAVIKPVMDLR